MVRIVMQIKFKKIKAILFLSVFLFTQNSFAASAAAGKSDFSVMEDSVRDAQIIIGTAAGGAVLGLSTLSFVDVPAEHLKSVVMGAAIGIILGVGIVVYQQAGKSQDYYLKNAKIKFPNQPPSFSTEERLVWHKSEQKHEKQRIFDRTTQDILFAHSFSF